MKKLLLLVTFLISVAVTGQVFWENKALTTPVGRRVQSISYVDANIVWGHLGYNGPLPAGDPHVQEWVRSVDGGQTWVKGTINVGNTDLGFGNIHAVSTDVAYVIAFLDAGGAAGGVWKTINGGVNWTKQPTASFNSTTSFGNFVHFWNANEGVCMGDPAGGYFEIYTTINGGTNWTRVSSSNIPIPLTDEYGLTNEFRVIGDTIWFSTNGGRLMKSTNKGLTWSAQVSPVVSFYDQASSYSAKFAFSDANNGIVLDSDYGFFNTIDGGSTWNPLPAGGSLRNGNISSVPGLPNTYVINGDDLDNTARGSSYTIDGGITWENINPLGDVFAVLPDTVKFFDASSGLTGGVSSSSTVGGIFKYVGTQLADALSTPTFSNDNTFKASPNPTTGLVALTGKNIENVIVTDVLGKQVSNTNYTSLSNVNLDLTAANAGLYMVKVTNNEGNVSTLKVVKQ
jgi:Secretion system C-terminal sorting domain